MPSHYSTLAKPTGPVRKAKKGAAKDDFLARAAKSFAKHKASNVKASTKSIAKEPFGAKLLRNIGTSKRKARTALAKAS